MSTTDRLDKIKIKVNSEIRDESGKWSEDALALSKDVEEFTKDMIEKYGEKISGDMISYIITQSVNMPIAFSIAFNSK